MFNLLGKNHFQDEQEDVVLCPPGGEMTIKAKRRVKLTDTTAVGKNNLEALVLI